MSGMRRRVPERHTPSEVLFQAMPPEVEPVTQGEKKAKFNAMIERLSDAVEGSIKHQERSVEILRQVQKVLSKIRSKLAP